jgi:hypothetical protein
MSLSLRGRTATTNLESEPPHPHSHHLGDAVAAVFSHVPHSLPAPHVHYPPVHPNYLETARLSREMEHL